MLKLYFFYSNKNLQQYDNSNQVISLPDEYGNSKILSLNGVSYAVPHNFTFYDLHMLLDNKDTVVLLPVGGKK